MNFLPSLMLLLSVFLTGCASQSITEYPLYTDQVISKMAEAKQNKVETSTLNEIPDFSQIPNNVAAGHSFSISHPSDSTLSGVYRSDFNGNLLLPYKVEVNVMNKTFAEVKEQVLRSYSKFFQKGVEGVNFTISKKDIWIEIRGMVKKPGRYLVKESDTLDLIVDEAGGVQGDIGTEYFSASIKSQKFNFKVLLNKYFESSGSSDKIKWLGGDNIFISKIDNSDGKSQEVPFVTVLGGVARPGKILYQKDSSLYYFIEKSGGAINGLSYDECYIFRNTASGVKKIQFSFNKPETIPVILPNDTVFMNSQVRSFADIVLERVGHITSIISTIALLVIAL